MDFTIRNLPAPVLEDLERAARLNGRSVEEEAVLRLESRGACPSAVDRPLAPDVNSRAAEPAGGRRSVEEWLAAVEEMQKRHPLPELTPELLDQWKREGRA